MRIRKYIIAALLLVLCLGMASTKLQAQSTQEYDINRLMQLDGITVVQISSSMMNMTRSSLEEATSSDIAMHAITKEIQKLMIFSAETPREMAILKKEFAFLSPKKSKKSRYQELMFVKDGKKMVRMFGIPAGKKISNLFLEVSEPDEYTIISFEGLFSKESVDRMIAQ